jgi:twinkle protein
MTCFSGNHREDIHGPKRWKDGTMGADAKSTQVGTSDDTLVRDPGGVYMEWKARGLTEETCRKYDVLWCPQKKVWVHWYHDDKGARIGYQSRGADKTFKVVGDITGSFFGQRTSRGGGKRLTITEGQVDAMSLSQAMGHKESVVSIPSGTGSVRKAIQKQCTWLASFDEIRLCFDMDEAGRAATEVALKELQKVKPGGLLLMSLPRKDANEVLLKEGPGALVRAFWAAQRWQPPGFVDMGQILDEALKEPQWGSPYPWQGLTDITYGRRPGEIVTWVAASGIGKTSVLSSITAQSLHEGNTVGCIFLEQPPHEMSQRILGVLYGKAMHDPSVVVSEEEREEAKQMYRECGGRVVFFDAAQSDSGEKTWGPVREAIQYLAIAEGCTSIILDNFTCLLDHKEGTDTELHQIVKELKADAARLNICVDAVSHVRKEGKGAEKYEDGAFPKVSEIYGSGAIDRYSSFLFLVARNKCAQDDAERNTTRIKCGKDRFTGRHDGKIVELLYDPETSRLTEVDDPVEMTQEETPEGLDI